MTHDFPDLAPCEVQLAPSDELLYRQITKHKWNEVQKVPASAAFGPVSADDGRPSFARSSAEGVTEQSSRDWHQQHARTPSLGVWAVTSAEVNEAELRSVDDSACPLPAQGVRAPGHCYVDYRGLTPKQVRDARAELLLRALSRKELPTSDCLAQDEQGGSETVPDESQDVSSAATPTLEESTAPTASD